jgi:DNA-binding NarL/FixJ family response regulator
MGGPLRVMLVDDHEVVRGGIRALLEGADGLVVCAEAASAAEAVAAVERALPDVIVMDVWLGTAAASRRPATSAPSGRRPGC